LIEEYLAVLLDGARAPIEAEPSLAARVGDLDAALDYGLHGQRIESLVRIFSGAQGLAHERLQKAFEGALAPARLQQVLDQPVDPEHYSLLRPTHPPRETFELEIEVNRWLFARAGSGLSDARSSAAVDDLLKLDPSTQAAHRQLLREFFVGASPLSDSLQGELAGITADVLSLERRCLRAVGEEQRRLNDRLKRPSAGSLTGADLAIYTRPRSGPPLESTLADGLGIAITTVATSSTLAFGEHRLTLTD
jgi:hypothetical protein